MEKILTDFGVQPVYLAAQVINFIILLLILKRFLYKPILKVLDERKQIAAKSLSQAELIEEKLQLIENESARKLQEVTKQAQRILDNASEAADKIISDAHIKAKADVDQIMEKGRLSLAAERERVKKEMTEELSGLVLMGIEKVSGKIIDQPDHLKLLDQTLDSISARRVMVKK